MISYFAYFTLNFVLELFVACFCLPNFRFRRLATVLLLLNLATHPALWFVLCHAYNHYWSALLIGEVLVFIVEALLGLQLLDRALASKARILFTVAACNLFSFAFTFII